MKLSDEQIKKHTDAMYLACPSDIADINKKVIRQLKEERDRYREALKELIKADDDYNKDCDLNSDWSPLVKAKQALEKDDGR